MMKARFLSYLKNLKVAASFLLKKKLKFNVGSGGINYDNSWYASDISVLDITKKADWRKLLLFMKVDNVFAEHVWEHLTDADTFLANKNCYHFLKKHGILRLAVPDGYNPDNKYIEYVRPCGNGVGADDHKVLYNYKIMKERLEEVGFKVTLLEYWDEFGKLHSADWSDDNGKVERSLKYDSRNKDGIIGYTSLIVDAVKL